jgi:hypothetical protein
MPAASPAFRPEKTWPGSWRTGRLLPDRKAGVWRRQALRQMQDPGADVTEMTDNSDDCGSRSPRKTAGRIAALTTTSPPSVETPP